MRRAMADAPVGDEQRGEDPTTRRLEERVAQITGKAAALFAPSGTLCNVLALFLLCRPGDEVLVERDAHIASNEHGGPAVHSRVTLVAAEGCRGVLGPDAMAAATSDARPGFHRVTCVCVENTHRRAGGAVWSPDEIEALCSYAARRGVRIHLDGARLFNAAVAQGVAVARLCSGVDSVWIDLSKGLGCPGGAVLAGPEEFIAEARAAKRLFGGALRQSGVLAAAGLHAIDHHVARLAEDHDRAKRFAAGAAEIGGVQVDLAGVVTNIVLLDLADAHIDALALAGILEARGLRLATAGCSLAYAVTHLDVNDAALDTALSVLERTLDEQSTYKRRAVMN